MPLPTPNENEKEEEFIARCVPLVLEAENMDADEEDDRKQAVAICYSQWRQANENKAAQGVSGEGEGQPRASAGQANKEASMDKGTGTKAVTKKEGDGDHPAGHYLVVEDAEKVSTWHLRVKDVDGELDHNLMGAAWAALHEGYRGKEYEGPNKQEAITKLKKLYEQEDMEVPEVKALSREEESRLIWQALDETFGQGLYEKPSYGPYIEATYDDHIIVERGNQFFKITYSIDEEGKVTFGEPEEMEKIEEYVPAKAMAVKFADEAAGIIEGLAIPYGGPMDGKDLQGEYFSSRTDFALKWFDKRPVLYHHGLDEDVQIVPVGVQFETKAIDAGRWARAQLDKAHEYYEMIADMVRQSKLFFSSGSMPHLVEKADDGELLRWPWVELSLTPTPANPYAVAKETTKAHFQAVGLKFVDLDQGEAGRKAAHDAGAVGLKGLKDKKANHQLVAPQGARQTQSQEVFDMDKQKLNELVKERVDAVLAAKAEAEEEAATAQKALDEQIEAKAREMALKMVKGRKIDFPTIALSGALALDHRYSHLDAADLAFAIEAIKGAGQQPSEAMLKACAIKSFDAVKQGHMEAAAIKGLAGIKTGDEVMHSDLTSYGVEWVPTIYASELWRKLRLGNKVLGLFRTLDMPSDPYRLPYEGGDPTVYYIAETADLNQMTIGANQPIGESKVGTGYKTLDAKKLGAFVPYSEELVEDSIIPIAAQLRAQMGAAMSAAVDNVLLNGDTETGASASINKIDGTPTSTGNKQDKYLVFNALRKLALVTNTDNSRDGGTLTSDDYMLTRALMGKYGVDPTKLGFVVDYHTYQKSIPIDDCLTLDKLGPKATILTGQLLSMFGVPIIVSEELVLANSAGKIPTAGGTLGQIVGVYRPGWLVGFRRQIKVTLEKVPLADAYYIMATIRIALINFDNEVSAVSYNLTV